MKIECAPTLNFNARCVRRQNIQCNSSSRVIPSSIVKIDTSNPKDIKALGKAIEGWGEGDSYGKYIVNNAKLLSKKKTGVPNSTIYALTLQQGDFETLDWEKILGLCELIKHNKNKAEINFLQVKPECAGVSQQKQYSNIGRSIIKMFQSMPSNRALFAKADYRAANFYEKMNFEIINPKQLLYRWTCFKGLRFMKR